MAATDIVRVFPLAPAEADGLWPEIESFVADALRHDMFNTISVDEIQRQISSGYAVVLATASREQLLAATVCQLYKTREGERLVHVLTTAGTDSDRWLPQLIESLKTLAQTEHCGGVTMSGRPGWARKLKQYGFRTHHVDMRMNVDEQQQGQQSEPQSVTVARQ